MEPYEKPLTESQKMALESMQLERMRVLSAINERYGRFLRALEQEHGLERGTLVLDQTRQGQPFPVGAKYALDEEQGLIQVVPQPASPNGVAPEDALTGA